MSTDSSKMSTAFQAAEARQKQICANEQARIDAYEAISELKKVELTNLSQEKQKAFLTNWAKAVETKEAAIKTAQEFIQNNPRAVA